MAEEQAKIEDNVILVGQKPSMAYVLGVVTIFSEGKSDVMIKARGRAISRAVDVAEIVRRRFVQDANKKHRHWNRGKRVREWTKNKCLNNVHNT